MHSKNLRLGELFPHCASGKRSWKGGGHSRATTRTPEHGSVRSGQLCKLGQGLGDASFL